MGSEPGPNFIYYVRRTQSGSESVGANLVIPEHPELAVRDGSTSGGTLAHTIRSANANLGQEQLSNTGTGEESSHNLLTFFALDL